MIALAARHRHAGARGVMTGDYLTTQGVEPGADMEEFRRLGLRAE